jgi:hypothetical protein
MTIWRSVVMDDVEVEEVGSMFVFVD